MDKIAHFRPPPQLPSVISCSHLFNVAVARSGSLPNLPRTPHSKTFAPNNLTTVLAVKNEPGRPAFTPLSQSGGNQTSGVQRSTAPDFLTCTRTGNLF